MDKSRRRTISLAAVEAWLNDLPGTTRRLRRDELRSNYDVQFIAGWRLEVMFPDAVRRLDLLFDDRFPRAAPRVALVDRPEFLTWPHFEKNGLLCVVRSGAQVNTAKPLEVAKYVIREACQLIEDSAEGLNENDFRTEFLSYWDWSINEGAPNFSSLVGPQTFTRLIRVWRGQQFYLIGDNEEEIVSWLKYRYGNSNSKIIQTEEAVLLYLERPLLPREFPTIARDVLRIAESMTDCGAGILTKLARGSSGPLVVVFASSTTNGFCLAGVTILPPRSNSLLGQRRQNLLTRGFRPGKVPAGVLTERQFGVNPARPSRVDRVDASWVHGRDQDPRLKQLRASTVAILGLGSVGAPVALLLAQAGIGRFIFVDPEKLASANVGRHPLGAANVGLYKTVALAERIKQQYPHILSVDAQARRWEQIAADAPGLLSSCDLIVSTMGDWSAEGALNEWHLSQNRHPPIVYGWTEAHACAGHAVIIRGGGGCLQCGFDDTGVPHLRVTKWPNGPTERQEPACGAVYQPYGPVELGHIIAMISELALDSILYRRAESTHRVWVGRSSLLKNFGGEWTTEWANIARDRGEGGFIEERPWPMLIGCIECSAGKHA